MKYFLVAKEIIIQIFLNGLEKCVSVGSNRHNINDNNNNKQPWKKITVIDERYLSFSFFVLSIFFTFSIEHNIRRKILLCKIGTKSDMT